MMTTSPAVQNLIQQLDAAVELQDCTSLCTRVKDILHDVVSGGDDVLPAELLEPTPGKYARRLLHKDPQNRYSVVIMVWGEGQGTPLHDHCGHWCVECVYRGRIKVVSYSKQSEEGERFTFVPEKEVFAGCGDAGALIPPFEYHTIENAEPTPSVTIHVYAEELEWCYIFQPTEAEGEFERVRRDLCYSS